MREPLPVHPVMLELVLLSLSPEGVQCRVREVPLLHGSTVLQQAQKASGVPAEDVPRTLFHGTSWRHQDGAVHLTWAVGPDPQPDGEGLRVLALGADRQAPGRLDDPTPEGVQRQQVAEHAVQHVAWLAERDPQMFAGALDQELWQAVERLSPVRARNF